MLSFSIHNKRKHNAQSSCLKLAILILGQYRNAFLAYLLNSRKRLQRYEKYVRWKRKDVRCKMLDVKSKKVGRCVFCGLLDIAVNSNPVSILRRSKFTLSSHLR